jgi:endonuclease YncB( thermonuclease family)
MNRSLYLFALLFSFLIPPSIISADITVLQGRQQFKIRLGGIDTPEKGQDFGNKAKRFTSGRVLKKHVRVKDVGTDRYGRTIGMVYYDGGCLNEDLVRSGYAWVYRKYCVYPVCSKWLGYEKGCQTEKNRALGRV